MANLVILESPTKATTIKGYLGSNYKVIASQGHVRDLPKSSMGIDIENGFEPHYINIRGRGDIIKEIKKEAKGAGKIYLATDPDREGEAISWHLATVLGLPIEKTMRITFNEITKTAVKAAIKAPRKIDMDIVDAQQTRRLLDRIVGYKLSPYLWKTVRSGLSAGRVQSVATRIIVEREEEIRAFVPKEYWTIDVTLEGKDGKPFVVHFYGDKGGKLKLENEAEAMKVVNAVSGKQFTAVSVKRATKHKTPAPPFTTSTLLQEATRKLGFHSQRIMNVAQELYEGINLGNEFSGTHGLITYMRTDSLRISEEAQQAAKEYIVGKYGEKYHPGTPRVYKTHAGAQDAHEAIRPTNILAEPAKVRKMLTNDQYKLYKLIWERFIASQMQSAELSTLSLDFDCSGYIFKASGYTVTFPGFMALYGDSEEDSRIVENGDEPDAVKDMKMPDIKEGDKSDFASIDPLKHFTEAPPRFTEGSLVKFLEDKGIGRPSTLPTIITTIMKNYVSRSGKALVPTQLGEITTKIMKEHFASIIDYKFTANIETELDRIESGEEKMDQVLSEFWSGFSKQLENAEKDMGSVEVPVETTDMICDKCGSQMIVKNGRYGKFAACPNYPTCKNTKPLTSPEEEEKEEKQLIYADFKCEKCGSDMVMRTGKFGSFYACIQYPKCKYTKPRVKELGVPCPKCGSKLVTKYGKNKTVFYSCEKYPECEFSSWDMPTKEICPECGKMLMKKKGKALLVCMDKENCKYSRQYTESETNGQNEQ